MTERATVFAVGVTSLETPKGKVWVKTVEPPSWRYHRVILAVLGSILPVPILRRAKKGRDTLLRQAEQARVLQASGVKTAEVLYVDRSFLILADAGIVIERALRLPAERDALGLDEDALRDILKQMTITLADLHARGLAHGRPRIRDFAWRDGIVTILDLEERPWEVMPMAAAQARDVLLWLMDLCSGSVSRAVAGDALSVLSKTMQHETEAELRKAVRMLGRFAPPFRWLSKTLITKREMVGALAAYDLLRAHFVEKT